MPGWWWVFRSCAQLQRGSLSADERLLDYASCHRINDVHSGNFAELCPPPMAGGEEAGSSSVIVVTRLQAGTISNGLRVVIIRAIILRINRKAAGTALMVALMLALHDLALCASAVPECAPSALHTPPHQDEGCHHHQHQGSRQSHGCVCCESVLCEPRAELTGPDSRSIIDRTMFLPLSTATLLVNSAVARLRGASEPPPLHSPPRFFLIHRTLLI